MGLVTSPTSSSPKSITILGMHRSGTSMLAGTLRSHGVYFGDVLDQNIQHNPKGLQEAPAILYMHEDLLVKNGGSWHAPPDTIEWQPMHKAVRDLYIESRQSHACWAFKDPRTLLVLDGWIDVLPSLKAIGIFRHPAEVAASIHKRNGFDIDKCLDIWITYNQRLLTHRERLGFPILEFVGDGIQMQASIQKAIQSLELETPDSGTPFFEADLKHQNRPTMDLPEPALSLYRALQSNAL